MDITKVNNILDLVREKDMVTYEHLERTAMFTFALAKALKLEPHRLEQAYFAGLLHDVGVLEASDDNPKIVAQYGSVMLKFIDKFEEVAEAIKHQHECIQEDCKGDIVCLLAQIIAIANKYDEMRNMANMSHQHAVEALKQNEEQTLKVELIQPFVDILEKEDLMDF
jgi:HD-GYP domain-containing protein (c-di-GMP phosphodiesterase class II)